MSIVPPAIYTYPLSASSLFSLCSPSLLDVMLISPPATRILSFASSPCPAASNVYVPLVTFKSFLEVIAFPALDVTARVPSPFNVISSFEKITASILLSSIATYSADVVSLFSLLSASVINTLSAAFTYIAALDLLVISTPLSTN